MSWKKEIQNKWHDLINSLFGSIGDFFDALMDDIAKSGGKLLIEAATAAVEAAEKTGGSGSEKFNSAYDSIVRTLTSAGIPILMHAINGAIEAAVAQMKAKQ